MRFSLFSDHFRACCSDALVLYINWRLIRWLRVLFTMSCGALCLYLSVLQACCWHAFTYSYAIPIPCFCASLSHYCDSLSIHSRLRSYRTESSKGTSHRLMQFYGICQYIIFVCFSILYITKSGSILFIHMHYLTLAYLKSSYWQKSPLKGRCARRIYPPLPLF